MTIPRIVHQTINDKGGLDELALKNVEHLKDLNNGWDYRLYDDAERRSLILKHYGSEMLARYDSIGSLYGAAKADLFRYLLVYEFGGVYLDIKSTIHTPLDETLRPDDEYILSTWNNRRGESHQGWGIHPNIDGVKNEYQQWHVIAAAKHPFLAAVIARVAENIDQYNPVTDGVGRVGVMKLTGPVAYTAAITPILNLHAHRETRIDSLGFEYSIYPPTTTLRHGHFALFSSHYSRQVVPIIQGKQYTGVERLIVDGVTQYRLMRRQSKNLVKRLVGRI